jgi:hypothetical protein
MKTVRFQYAGFELMLLRAEPEPNPLIRRGINDAESHTYSLNYYWEWQATLSGRDSRKDI